MKHISYDETCGSVDLEQWLRLTAEDNSAQHSRLKRNLLKAIREELRILCYGVQACLSGLKEQGCNGPVTDALTHLEKHLNKKAHAGDD